MISANNQKSILNMISAGLPICEKPFQHIAQQFQLKESDVREFIESCLSDGLIKRFGMVVNHHKIGYQSNAMVVWNIPDEQVEEVGSLLASQDRVRLCYQRPRRLPHWPYNLFTMIHGKCREEVLDCLANIIKVNRLDYSYDVLFSTKKLKQKGAQYAK